MWRLRVDACVIRTLVRVDVLITRELHPRRADDIGSAVGGIVHVFVAVACGY